MPEPAALAPCGHPSPCTCSVPKRFDDLETAVTLTTAADALLADAAILVKVHSYVMESKGYWCRTCGGDGPLPTKVVHEPRCRVADWLRRYEERASA